MTEKMLKVSDGKREWFARKVAVDCDAGTLSLDGKHTIMIHRLESLSMLYVTLDKVVTKAPSLDEAKALGALKVD